MSRQRFEKVNQTIKRLVLSMMIATMLCFVGGCGNQEEEAPQTLKMIFFNQMPWIQGKSGSQYYHGDCTYIELPDGQNMLVDISTQFSGEEITDILVEMGVEKIDYFVISHLHQDHVAGFGPLSKKIEIGNVIYSGYGEDNSDAYNILWLIEKKGINILTVKQEDSLDIGGVHFSFLFPGEDVPPADKLMSQSEAGTQLNMYSMVFRMTYGDFSALFTGDIHVETEKKLREQYGEQLQSTMLKVPHHGNETSTSGEFVAAVNPQFAVVMSTGCAWSVQRRFSNRCIPLYGTYSDGDIVVETDGSWLKVKCDKGVQEYPLSLDNAGYEGTSESSRY